MPAWALNRGRSQRSGGLKKPGRSDDELGNEYGRRTIRNTGLRDADPAEIGPRSGQNRFDANVLRLKLTFGYTPKVPVVGGLWVKAMKLMDAGDDPYRTQLLDRGLIPIAAQATQRMQTDPVDDGGGVTIVAGTGGAAAGAGPPPNAPEPPTQPPVQPKPKPAPQKPRDHTGTGIPGPAVQPRHLPATAAGLRVRRGATRRARARVRMRVVAAMAPARHRPRQSHLQPSHLQRNPSSRLRARVSLPSSAKSAASLIRP